MSYQEISDIRYSGSVEGMQPKRIGFFGFDGVSASDLMLAADIFAGATLDGGYGNRLSCYHICIIGFSFEVFRSDLNPELYSDRTARWRVCPSWTRSSFQEVKDSGNTWLAKELLTGS